MPELMNCLYSLSLVPDFTGMEILKGRLLKCRIKYIQTTFSEDPMYWVCMTEIGYWQDYRGGFCEKLPETSACLMPASSKLNRLLAKAKSISYMSVLLYISVFICCQKFRVYFLLAGVSGLLFCKTLRESLFS